MSVDTHLSGVSPDALAPARAVAHKAVQLVSMAARANLVAAPDDSHSNLAWDSRRQRFLSQAVSDGEGEWLVSASLDPLEISLVRDEETIELKTLDGVGFTDALSWLDAQLAKAGLKSASGATVPYALPDDAAAVTEFATGSVNAGLGVLASWFDLANAVLTDFAIEHSDLKPGPSPVRCWPHHFDIATYVSLEEGDSETARGIGVGMSPGDETYDQPYFYINPWPHLKPENLPPLPAPGQWHTQGFVGAIATADNILSQQNPSEDLRKLIEAAFSIGRSELGV